jgi:dTDP-glucose 4,6-dehydratase
MKILVTGGQGFIGSNLVRMILAERPGWRVVNLDDYSYAGGGKNLADVEEAAAAAGRYRAVKVDVADMAAVSAVFREEAPEAVLHLAAESHVDRSILASGPFVRTNVEGTRVVLEAARAARTPRFLHVSTDEVYGDLGPEGKFTEETPLAPNSPYSASKAASDLLARAFWRTYELPVVITRCSNNYGPFQFPEKLIPLMIGNALDEKPLPVSGGGRPRRDWIHVDDHCRGLLAALERGVPGEVYNFGGDSERENLHVVKRILALLGRPESLIRYVTDRPGHDRRYAIDASKAKRALGWAPAVGFEEGLERTVAWYRAHEAWWRRLQDAAYREFYAKQYGAREAKATS